jgi:anti-anti-sigma regulatory factor
MDAAAAGRERGRSAVDPAGRHGGTDAHRHGCVGNPGGPGRPGADDPPRRGETVVGSLADAVPLVVVTGELTGDSAVRLRHTVGTHLAIDPRLVVLDLRAVDALPQDGGTALVEIAYEAGARNIGLCLVCGPDDRHPVRVALREAETIELFEVQPDLDAALDTLC